MNGPAAPMAAPKAQRHARGKRPRFYAERGMDDAVAMIVVLAQELCVLRDRMDAVERVAAKHGIDMAREIEALSFDQPALDARESRRQELFGRLFYLQQKEADELAKADSETRYRQVIDEIAAP